MLVPSGPLHKITQYMPLPLLLTGLYICNMTHLIKLLKFLFLEQQFN